MLQTVLEATLAHSERQRREDPSFVYSVGQIHDTLLQMIPRLPSFKDEYLQGSIAYRDLLWKDENDIAEANAPVAMDVDESEAGSVEVVEVEGEEEEISEEESDAQAGGGEEGVEEGEDAQVTGKVTISKKRLRRKKKADANATDDDDIDVINASTVAAVSQMIVDVDDISNIPDESTQEVQETMDIDENIPSFQSLDISRTVSDTVSALSGLKVLTVYSPLSVANRTLPVVRRCSIPTMITRTPILPPLPRDLEGYRRASTSSRSSHAAARRSFRR